MLGDMIASDVQKIYYYNEQKLLEKKWLIITCGDIWWWVDTVFVCTVFVCKNLSYWIVATLDRLVTLLLVVLFTLLSADGKSTQSQNSTQFWCYPRWTCPAVNLYVYMIALLLRTIAALTSSLTLCTTLSYVTFTVLILVCINWSWRQ